MLLFSFASVTGINTLRVIKTNELFCCLIKNLLNKNHLETNLLLLKIYQTIHITNHITSIIK